LIASLIIVLSASFIFISVVIYPMLDMLYPSPDETVSSKTLSIAISTDIKTLDIAKATSIADFEILGNVYETLFRITYDVDQGKLKYVPWLVDYYAQVNKTFWVFKLKNNIVFHNGKTLTAYDVNASIVRAITAGGIPQMLFTDTGGKPIIDRIVVFNETYFGIALRKPFAPLIEHLAHLSMGIMPRDLAEKYMNQTITDINDVVGTGPYKIVSWERGLSAKLAKFENYWRGVPKIDEINYLIMPDANTRIIALKSGQVDIAIDIPPEAIDQLRIDGFNIIATPVVRHVIVAINTQRLPDTRIRCALNYAVDKESIVTNLMKGYAKVSNSVISTIFPGAKELKPFNYNPVRAVELINEAGGINRTLTLIVSTKGSKDLELAEIIRHYLKNVGVDVRIVPMEHTAFLNKVFTEHDFDLAIYGPSPSSTYYALSYWKTGSYLNGPLYSNTLVDELLEKATSITNETERFELYEQIQEIIWNECPAIWLYYEDLIVATKGGITNLVVLPFQKLELDNVVGLG